MPEVCVHAVLLSMIIPFVAAEEEFALKGGTAINLFLRGMPRLSVDIDLTYLKVAGWTESLAAIDAAMKRLAVSIRNGFRGTFGPRAACGVVEAKKTRPAAP